MEFNPRSAKHALDAMHVAAEIWPLVAPRLAGKPPEVQGAALADLVATFLAGHMVAGDPEATAKLREELLTTHIEIVRQLIPVNEKDILARVEPKGSA